MGASKEHLFHIYDLARKLHEDFGGVVDTSGLEEQGRKLGVDLAEMRNTRDTAGQNPLQVEEKGRD
jgi:hypothetical protein